MSKRRKLGRVKVAYLIGGGLMVAFGAVGVVAFNNSTMSYATIEEARLGSYCAVKGDVNRRQRRYDPTKKVNVFTLSDRGGKIEVEYQRPLPANFDQVKQVVVKGRFQKGVFEADDVLTK